MKKIENDKMSFFAYLGILVLLIFAFDIAVNLLLWFFDYTKYTFINIYKHLPL